MSSNLTLNELLEGCKGAIPPSVTPEEIKCSVAFTGYRPSKLPFGDDYESKKAIVLKLGLYNVVDRLMRKNYRYFMNGGAMGSDLLAAEAVIDVKKDNKRLGKYITNYFCLPCHDHTKQWTQKEKNRLEALMNESSICFYVSDKPYYSGCMQVRNKYMVDTADVLVAVYDGKPGGTHNTVEYAKKRNKKIIIINPNLEVFIEFIDDLEDLDFKHRIFDSLITEYGF